MFKYLKRLFRTADEPATAPVQEICKILKYRFKNSDLLLQALTHRSYLIISGKSALESNERLEFLGDAVLDLAVTEYLFKKYMNKLEGELSKIKAVLVSRQALAQAIHFADLNKYMLMNRGEEKTGGKRKTSNLANLYEALVAAIYLDGGLASAKEFIRWTLLDNSEVFLNSTTHINYKSILLEYSQKQNSGEPVYRLVSEQGPDHEKTFVIDVCINNGEKAIGAGRSKKGAEQRAARELLNRIAPELIRDQTEIKR